MTSSIHRDIPSRFDIFQQHHFEPLSANAGAAQRFCEALRDWVLVSADKLALGKRIRPRLYALLRQAKPKKQQFGGAICLKTPIRGHLGLAIPLRGAVKEPKIFYSFQTKNLPSPD